MSTFILRDDQGSEQAIEAEDLPAARAAAEAWARGGDWNLTPEDGTIWVRVAIVDGGEDVDRVTVRIDPTAPRCSGGTHDWQSPHAIVGGIKENPGVHGHGGGVVIHEVCMHCGCGRLTDTWASDRATGEQGLESVSYEPNKYAFEIAAYAASYVEVAS